MAPSLSSGVTLGQVKVTDHHSPEFAHLESGTDDSFWLGTLLQDVRRLSQAPSAHSAALSRHFWIVDSLRIRQHIQKHLHTKLSMHGSHRVKI